MTQTARSPIALLPESLINKIAAGEVVERPASVVKELLENAIDAGATRLAVAIEEGGRALIRVTDNGCGIPADQAALAFAQHATSKIQTVDDLFAIGTMGFRGEALASIGSVSHATMVTRTADAQQGTRIEVKDALVSPAAPCAGPVGTTIEVRDLFYSVPARRKFLRSDATEFGHIHEMVLRIALPNPQVSLTLSHNGRPALELPATTDWRSRVAAALGGGEAGGMNEALIPVDFCERGVTVRGFVGQPSLARATAKYQYVFLNGRYIRDRSILHALKEAYRGLIEPTTQPVGVLFLQMDPLAFDVNVHPQKTEVRFRDSNGPYSVVLAAVREHLLGTDLTPAFVGPRGEGRGGGGEKGEPSPGWQSGAAPEAGAAQTRQVIADFFRQATPAQPRLAFGPETRPNPIDDPSRITVPTESSMLPKPNDLTLVQHVTDAFREGTPVAPAAPADMDTPVSTLRPLDPSTPAVPRFIQLHNTYLIVQTPDGLLIIDQHALHERILYEELYARVTRAPLEGQRLLIPEVLPISPRHQGALEIVRPLLLDLGIEVAPFDAQSVAVHSFPSLLSKVSPREFLRELLDKMLELGGKLTREELLHEVLDMASCKAAVKAGYPLSEEEIRTLLARKELVERSSNCPHGRPTTLRMTIHDLERQFKRK